MYYKPVASVRLNEASNKGTVIVFQKTGWGVCHTGVAVLNLVITKFSMAVSGYGVPTAVLDLPGSSTAVVLKLVLRTRRVHTQL